MASYVVRRILQMVPLLVGISALLFLLLAAAPGDPVDRVILSNPNVRPEDVAALKRHYGLDQPVHVRYVKWLGRTLRGDLGWSLNYRVPVAQLMRDRFPNSLLLMGTGLLLSILVAVPVGIYSAVRQYSPLDYAASVGSFVGFSIPLFWFGLVMIYVFAVKLQVLPAGGFRTPGLEEPGAVLADRIRHMILPVLVIALYNMGSLVRYTRSSMLEVIRQDYIRTARAKGLAAGLTLRRHALPNAMIPIVTVLALTLPIVVGGAPVTETVFGWPGVGQLLVHSVIAGDFQVAMAVLMLIATVVVAFNLLADAAYAFLDPRIRYG